MIPLTLPESRIPNLSKVCDIYDWFDPAVDHIVRHHFKVTPGATRRTWEFAMIFLALYRHGKLNPDAVGLGMGAGTERLIFAIADQVAQVRATDLYEPGSRWVGVRTDNPQDLIEKLAPWPTPPGRIIAERADMRALQYADNSFDFAWSTGAFEHIGEDKDFIAHFNEVNRVLKPGGVYAFTTVVSYAADSHRIPHNHYFNPNHLVDLMHASDLVPDPVFDVRVTDNHFNKPVIESFAEFGCAGAGTQIHPVVALRRGTINVANLCVLRKGDGSPKQRPEVLGFQETHDQLWRLATLATRRLWADWQTLRLRVSGQSAVTARHFFGSARVAVEVQALDRAGCDILVEIDARNPAPPVDVQTPKRYRLRPGDAPITFQAQAGQIYTFKCRRSDGGDPRSLRIAARHQDSDATASLTPPETPSVADQVGDLVRGPSTRLWHKARQALKLGS